MYEKVAYPYIALARFNSIDKAVMEWLVEKEKLPRDILVRAQLHGRDTYADTVNGVVLAALNDDPLPDFVTEPLPNAFEFYVAANHDYAKAPQPLAMLGEDFHEFLTLRKIAESIGINHRLMYPLWLRVIAEVQPDLALSIETEKNTTPYSYHSNRSGHMLRHSIIKDEPTYEVYRDRSLHPKLYRGIGRRCLLPLGYLLADNHPEIIEELDVQREKLS